MIGDGYFCCLFALIDVIIEAHIGGKDENRI